MKQAKATFKIVNKLGLHTRAAALFVKMASRYQSEVFLIRGKNRINGKSIMGILMLAAPFGSSITIETSGPDAREALEKLGKLVSQGFHES